MTKKYLILKNKPEKAQDGTPMSSDTMYQKNKPKTFAELMADGIGSGANSAANTDSQSTQQMPKMNTSGLVGMGLEAASMGSNYLFNEAEQKNQKYDGFGNPIVDNKEANLMKNQSAVGGALKGAGMGAQVGTMVGGPVGTLIGAGVGALAGGITGLITGKKKADKAKNLYNKGLDQNIMSAGRQQDIFNSKAITGKAGSKLGKITIPKQDSKTLILRNGGRIETPGEVNVVVKGKLHKENNNLGNKDKGIPVVNSNGDKEYEVEAGEIIFRQDVTHLIEDYARKYTESKDTSLFEELGRILVPELLKNTQDNYGQFGVKVKENETTSGK